MQLELEENNYDGKVKNIIGPMPAMGVKGDSAKAASMVDELKAYSNSGIMRMHSEIWKNWNV